ncbi:MAG TPA: SAM-dependent methyltransferase [Candidatus Megaira endosymbiont of Hartmannula sinica]|nr:SAM-dependent methyltransferase [Candidatus Megaera endosymbiont of Hartmannula sinica]
MTNIDYNIRKIISENSYITIDDFIKNSMHIHRESYYQNTKHIGDKGDFITSPEISQLFNETIALWIINKWEKAQKPSSFNLYELGSGKGTLISSILDIINNISKGCYDAIDNIYILDINNYFIARQKFKLLKHINNNSKKIKWLKSYKDITKTIKIETKDYYQDTRQTNSKISIVIANEFFDALPIKQYIKFNNKWFERVIKIKENQQYFFDKIIIQEKLELFFKNTYINAKDGACIEESPESIELSSILANLICKQKGAIIIIDYGYMIEPAKRNKNQFNPTLQAIYQHKYSSVTDNIGTSDLSAHVDFYQLITSFIRNKLLPNSIYYSSQSDFLKSYFIEKRARILIDKNITYKDIITRQLDRLISNQQMGNLFKTLEVESL